jgi:hypothetical protein
MGFAILWLAGLASGVLLVALALAQSVKMKDGRLATGLPFIAMLGPFAFGAVATVVAQQLHSQGLRPSYLIYALSWTTVFVIAAIAVIHFGSRRRSETVPMAAARWPRAVIAIALCASIAAYIGTLLYLDAGARRELAKVKAEAIQLAESVAPAPVPDEKNAALAYDQAFEATQELNKRGTKRIWFINISSERAPDFATEEVAEFLSEYAPALALLRKAASMPSYYIEAQYVPPDPNMQTPPLLPFHTAGYLLALDARLRAAEGDMRGALEDVATSWGMARHIAEMPTDLGCMFAVSIDSTGSKPVEDVLASGDVRREDLNGFPLDPDISFMKAHVRGWKMETAFLLHAVAESSTWDAQGMMHSSPHGIHWRVFVAPAFLKWIRPRILLVQEAVSEPYYSSRKLRAQIEAEVILGDGVLANFPIVTMTNVEFSSLAVAGAEAQHRLAVLGIATACFRTEEDRYPEELAELVPDYISAVPIDPFDGKPLKMLREGDGAVLYSVGYDYEDDGGKDRYWSFSGIDDTGDISFRLGEAYASALAKAKAKAKTRTRGRRPKKVRARPAQSQ